MTDHCFQNAGEMSCPLYDRLRAEFATKVAEIEAYKEVEKQRTEFFLEIETLRKRVAELEPYEHSFETMLEAKCLEVSKRLIARAEQAELEARRIDLELGHYRPLVTELRARASRAEAEVALLKEHVRCVINERELATDLLRSAEAELKAAREALEPFAKMAVQFETFADKQTMVGWRDLTVGDFRRARSPLSPSPAGEKS